MAVVGETGSGKTTFAKLLTRLMDPTSGRVMVGDIDLQGLLDLDESVPVGYRQITIEMDIDADCSDEELDELLDFAKAHSPTCNTVCRPVPVMVERVKR